MENTAKCYRYTCPYNLNDRCNNQNGSCGGNRWKRKPKNKKEN